MSERPSTLEEIFPEPPIDLNPHALDMKRIPEHVAVIMDGNGRWAKQRGLDRGQGHKAGIRAVREAITTCNDIGVRYLTIYSFSTENWNRPKAEVTGLMDLFAKTMSSELAGLDEEKVRVKLLGRVEDLPLATRTIFKQAEKRTAKNGGMTLAIAVNYGSRLEITDAVRTIARMVETGDLTSEVVSEDLLSAHLYTACPIRTFSFARAARCAFQTSCFGSLPTRSSTSPMCSGPTSTVMSCCVHFLIIRRVTVASEGSMSK